MGPRLVSTMTTLKQFIRLERWFGKQPHNNWIPPATAKASLYWFSESCIEIKEFKRNTPSLDRWTGHIRVRLLPIRKITWQCCANCSSGAVPTKSLSIFFLQLFNMEAYLVLFVIFCGLREFLTRPTTCRGGAYSIHDWSYCVRPFIFSGDLSSPAFFIVWMIFIRRNRGVAQNAVSVAIVVIWASPNKMRSVGKY